jgi:GntR family transcriptional regulator
MATITAIKVVPHTRIENSIIANMADLGVYAYAVYSAIKMHLNQASGDCFPSYATIARMTGMNRTTVIACVKKLTTLKLLSPQWRFREDGSHTSNQYDFHAGASPANSAGKENASPSQQGATADQTVHGGRPEQPPLVVQDNQGSRPEQPEQSPPNKKERTITDVDLLPTERQKTCPHPPAEIVFLADNITICYHCYGLLDENLSLQEEDKLSEGIVAA